MEIKRIKGHKYIWHVPTVQSASVLKIASTYSLSIPIAQVLVHRGFTTTQAVEEFLFTSYEKDVAHASLLKDANKAVDRIIRAIKSKEKILIFGDYDVDGITSSSLMMLGLLPLEAQVNFFLPHRVKDGYGLSSLIVERAAANGYSLIITVDNGITAFDAADKAQSCGIDLIITDHHRQHKQLPKAFAIVNPNQDDCPYPTKSLAGVGVTFKLIALLYEQLEKDLASKAYELLLLGTIADVVPLTQENRFWVRYGLNYINQTESEALKVLKQNAKMVKPRIRASDIGFSIAPQINALGRLEDPRDGVRFLIGSDIKQINQVGSVLFELNQVRKKIEKDIFEEVQHAIKEGRIDLEKENIIIAASKQWPPGVIGLVASRLVSMYGRPTILFHITPKGVAKGSCRSIPEFNIFNALTECKDLLLQFGGHSFAAGLSLITDNISALKKNLEIIIRQQLTQEDLQQKLMLDSSLLFSDVSKKFMHDMEQLEPFGHQNAKPTFYLSGVSLVKPPVLLKDQHVKCSLFADGIIKQCIFFNRPDIFNLLMHQGTDSFDVAVQVTENYWNGRHSIEFLGLDIALNVGE